VRLPGGRSRPARGGCDYAGPARCRGGPAGGQGGLTSHTCSTLHTFVLLIILIYQDKTGTGMVAECAKWSWSVQSAQILTIMAAVRGTGYSSGRQPIAPLTSSSERTWSQIDFPNPARPRPWSNFRWLAAPPNPVELPESPSSKQIQAPVSFAP
jgi:hypothetical protein